MTVAAGVTITVVMLLMIPGRRHARPRRMAREKQSMKERLMKRKKRCRITALGLCLPLLIASGCGPDSVSNPSRASEISGMDSVQLLLGGDYPTSEQTTKVEVDTGVINTVRPDIFGANLSWRGDGYGIWDSQKSAPNPELLESLQNSGVTHLRYPGGIEGDYFHWYESIGDVGNRVAQIDPFSRDYPTYDAYDGERYIATFGPDELIKLCRASGTAATIQLNAGNGTPEEAAQWVEYYLSQDVDTWTFAVGNEVCMAEERVEGMTVTKSPQEYIDFYNAVYDALGERVEDISLGCIGVTPSHPLNKYPGWDSQVLQALAGKIDFIDVHIGYTPYFSTGESEREAVECFMASSKWVKQMIDEEIALITANTGEYADGIGIQITEWGPVGGNYPNSVAGSLFAASFLHTVLAEPKVTSACYLPLTNHYEAANLLGSLTDISVTGQEVYWDNCVSYVFRMYAEQTGRSVLYTTVSGCKTFDSIAIGLVPAISDVPTGEAAVYFDEATGKGSLFLLNKSYDENTEFSVSLPFDRLTVDAVTELWDKSFAAKNSYANPTMVTPTEYPGGQVVTGGILTAVTKPVSLVKIDFTVS